MSTDMWIASTIVVFLGCLRPAEAIFESANLASGAILFHSITLHAHFLCPSFFTDFCQALPLNSDFHLLRVTTYDKRTHPDFNWSLSVLKQKSVHSKSVFGKIVASLGIRNVKHLEWKKKHCCIINVKWSVLFTITLWFNYQIVFIHSDNICLSHFESLIAFCFSFPAKIYSLYR